MITHTSIIEKIIFDITFKSNNKSFNGVEINYPSTEDWSLTMEDIHQEDNDSWNVISIGDKVYDIQFFGEDNTLSEDENGDYNPTLAMTIPLHFQMSEVNQDENGDWITSDIWLTSKEVTLQNVNIVTKDGTTQVVLH